MDNTATIERFYTAFQKLDHTTMASCYDSSIRFKDPVFTLEGEKAGAMWRMLCTRAKDLELTFDKVQAEGNTGSAHWEAHYTFSATGRKVHNKIDASFEFNDEGLIVRHTDTFPFWRWTRQALGLPGILLGWTPIVQGKVRSQANSQLERFIEKEKA